ncbi:MAG TPA: AMP-binding protein, partial [Polyangia bacterium]
MIRRASFIEEQFFLADELHPTAALNTITTATRIVGPLVAARLADALALVAARHPALRSRFAVVDGVITCSTDEAAPAARPLSVVNAADSDEATAQAAESLRLGVSPRSSVWAAVLLRHGAADHTLIFSAHRIAWDEASVRTLGQELSAEYHALTRGQARPASGEAGQTGGPHDLGGPPDEGRRAESARHFAAGLGEAPPLHAFPLKAARPRILPVETASAFATLDASTSALLGRRAEEWGVSPFFVECAAASYVLASYCGHPVLALGFPFDLRQTGHGGTTGKTAALGSSTTILPLGVNTAGAETFSSLVASLASQHRAAAAHAEVPFSAVVSAVGGRSDPSAHPLFQIAFAADEPLALDLDGCTCAPRAVPPPPQQVDLFVQVSSRSLRLDYLTGLVDAEMAASVVRSYAVFLAAALAAPAAALTSLPVIGDPERQRLVADATRTDDPSLLEPDLFATVFAHCRAGNDRPAIVCNGRRTTYDELAKAVVTLSARLAHEGVGPGELVGICLPRSGDMVVAMLAVLRNGAAYVPLDPAFPRDRLRGMVEHSRLSRIVTTGALAGLFEDQKIRIIETARPEVAHSPLPTPASAPPDATAYVIYTSGSTGKPKGVAIPRRALTNFLLSMVRRPGLSSSDVLCAVTTLSFDIAELELLGPLCVGATVVIATEEEARDPRLLIDLLQSHRVTVLQA